MKTFALFMVAWAALAASSDPREIMRQAILNYEKDARGAVRYSYTETDEDKIKGVEVLQETIVQGTPYERLVSRNGQPLTGEMEKREQQKYEKVVADRESETPQQRARRIGNYESQVKFVEEALSAFNFEMISQNGPDYVIECTPNPEYHPRDMKARMFTKIEARVWVDKQDLRIAKADATVTGTVSIGFILARIAKGGHIEFEQMRVADGNWFPKRISVHGKARIMLVDNKTMDEVITFSGYQPITRGSGMQVSKRQ